MNNFHRMLDFSDLSPIFRTCAFYRKSLRSSQIRKVISAFDMRKNQVLRGTVGKACHSIPKRQSAAHSCSIIDTNGKGISDIVDVEGENIAYRML